MPSPAAPASISTAIYWLIVLILAAIGYWLQSWPKAEIEARRRLPGWRKTSGTVTASRLDETPHASLSIPGRLLKLKADLYKPVISYSYSVGERTYQGSRYKNSFLSCGEEWQAVDRAAAAQVVAAHPAGTSVTVTYDPDDPASAYLEPDGSISRLFVFRTSGVVLLLAAALMFAAQRIYLFRQSVSRAHPARNRRCLPGPWSRHPGWHRNQYRLDLPV